MRKALELFRGIATEEQITELEYLIEEEEEIIKLVYEDAVDNVVVGMLRNEDWPSPDEYFRDNFEA
jgi:hypothetical protein